MILIVNIVFYFGNNFGNNQLGAGTTELLLECKK